MLKYIFILVLGFNLLPIAIAQTPSYWQQNVDYEIHVALNDVNHLITGNIIIKYTNNSPDTLRQIYMHVWPNAYMNTETALAKEFAKTNDFKMLKASNADLGFIDSLNFVVDGTPVDWKLDDTNPDIGVLTMRSPVLPGETIVITTPFRVKIPSSDFSRLGHSDQSYQITQWYPKPAVYDRKGWHPIPFLNQGEFYSEFGNFNVFITVPKNYIVAASGDLQTQDEIQFLNQKAIETSAIESYTNDLSFPPSDTETKTLLFTLKDAHDFAWFADKRFHVLKGQVQLPLSQRSVTTWAYFTNFEGDLWKNSIEYINRSVFSYSDWVGEYPWNVAQAVEGALSAGAGMEYPTITIIGASGSSRMLDNVITHEVGHNWFYGILGTNERDHAWMDEGINSYYEYRYLDKFYGKGMDLSALGLNNFSLIKISKNKNMIQLAWDLTAGLERMNRAQPIDITSAEFGSINYGVLVYMKTAYLMAYLADFFGQSQFDRVMAQYYKDWKFKHPYPEDMQEVLERESGENLNWFFDGLLKNDRSLDYKVKDVLVGKSTIAVRIQNNTDIAAPFPVSLMDGDSILRTEWQRGFLGTQSIFIQIPKGKNITHVRIDANESIPDNNRENNTSKLKGFLRKVEPLNFKPFISPDNPYHSTISYSPLIGGNANDGLMLGLGIWNSTFPAPKFEYVFAPMYAFNSNDLVGQGSVGINMYPKQGTFNRARLSVFGAHYTTDRLTSASYYKLQPQLDLDIKPKTFTSPITQFIKIKSAFIRENTGMYIQDSIGVEYYFIEDNWYHSVQYILNRKNILFPFQLNVNATAHSDFLNFSAEYIQKIKFPHYKQGISVRVFAGYVSAVGNKELDDRYALTLAGTNGAYDYAYNSVYLARNTDGTLLSNQMYRGNGFFKVPYYQPGISTSDNALVATNLVVHVPKTPIAFFGDFGFNSGHLIDGISPFQYDAGVMFKAIDNGLEIYFPLFASKDLPDLYAGNYTQYISCLININKLNLFEYLRTLKL
ncbi:MAG: M1 family metallopeptidase [Chitinophagales bacterium]|nr:M1 family metallopeptidase [Chitinophagales bacterium]MBP9797099.1 M1 family metallopeptidase [Chitinophagales bacterium]